MAIDIGQDEFPTAVLQRSMDRPVVVDFWAEWCGPCKVLGPILDRVAADHEDDFDLVKVDVDANQALAAQFGVQGIPTVIAFRSGQPVARFTGALGEAQVREWLHPLLPTEADRLVDSARDAQLEGDATAAEQAYRAALETEPGHHDAGTGLAALLIARGDVDEALIVLGKLARTADVEQLESAARLSAARDTDVAELEERLAANPSDASARIELATALAGQGEYEPALDHLLAVVRDDLEHREAARKAMIDVFGILGPTHPLTATYRRALANLLF